MRFTLVRGFRSCGSWLPAGMASTGLKGHQTVRPERGPKGPVFHDVVRRIDLGTG